MLISIQPRCDIPFRASSLSSHPLLSPDAFSPFRSFLLLSHHWRAPPSPSLALLLGDEIEPRGRRFWFVYRSLWNGRTRHCRNRGHKNLCNDTVIHRRLERRSEEFNFREWQRKKRILNSKKHFSFLLSL